MIRKLIKYIILWRLAILLVAYLSAFVFPLKDCCANYVGKLDFVYLRNIWTNFAGNDFLGLAKEGYGPPLELGTYVIFPFFPWLIRSVTSIVPDYVWSGLVLVHLSLIVALYLLYKLVLMDYKANIAGLTISLILFFPTAFFFGAVYTESFFLLLVVLTFYLARRKLFFLACLVSLLASSTRLAGIFLWPALAWEIWQSRDKTQLVWLILPPLGLLSYMNTLLEKTGDALFFLKVSPDFGPNLVVSKLILLHQVFFRYLKMLLFSRITDINYAVVLLELLVGTLFLVLIIASFKKLRLSYSIFMALSYLIPTLTGTFVSMPRYILTVFPSFILLSLWYSNQSELMKRFYIALNVVFGLIVVALFTRGYFVG